MEGDGDFFHPSQFPAAQMTVHDMEPQIAVN